MEFMEQWQYINILGHYISIFKPRKGLIKSQRGMKSDCLKKDLKESEIIILSEKKTHKEKNHLFFTHNLNIKRKSIHEN